MTDVPHLGKHWKDAAPRTQPQATIEPGIPEADRPLPLRGLKVVDAASFVAGTFGPSILAHYGASVVKLEPPEGDPYRLFSASFAAINQGKQGMVLDLKSEAGRAALTAMLQRADVFVENFRGRSRIQLGLEWDVLEKSNPRLVHCSVGAYGAGPLSDKPGFDPLLQARSGLIAAQGGPDEPSGSTMLVHDIGTGTMAAVGILAALYERESSARGQHVTTSLANSSLMLQAGEFTRYRHRPEPRLGCRDWPGPSPSQRLYRCADGWIFLDATEAGFDSVARALDLDVPRNSVSFEDVERALGDMPTVPALDRLSMKGVAAAKVLSRHDAFRDPWLLENRFYHVISDRALGRCRVIRTVTDWPESTDVPTKRSFLIGEDTREVLGSYRFSDTEISSLIESGVCVEVPVDGSSSRLA
jgi:crotonobetainyl-CoA:carnitine CoA-transferase CaiB-like acyl-CoA transferase